MYKKNVNNDLEANDIIEIINKLLKKDEILHETDEKLTILNLSDRTSYLGSINVYDENKLPKFEKELKKMLSKYENKSIRLQNVVSCCQAPHTNISFKIDILK
ncbi:MAG: hypothetical protein LBU74_04385 [Methanobacteriaceae archaeon]|jgi:hypothetical protein|nr:hypothetical protein [Candidatus Methanorudis spinitermitis]